MQIHKSGRSNSDFLDSLESKMKEVNAQTMDSPKEEQLAADRDEKSQKANTTDPLEVQIGDDRKGGESLPYEKLLQDSRKESKAAAPNIDMTGTIEKRMNEASQEAFPHRNPKAHERTGEKRPINALPEEIGNASDAAKNKRYEKSNTRGPKTILEKDIGEQKTIKSFNLREQKKAQMEQCKGYLEYKRESEGNVKVASERFAEAKKIDAIMASIMEQSASRHLAEDEMAQIDVLKRRKSTLLLKA